MEGRDLEEIGRFLAGVGKPDLYGYYGIRPTATGEELLVAYRARLRYLRFSLPPERVGVALDRLETAWQVLGNTARRGAYDASREAAARPDDEEEEPPETTEVG